jgi:hypothetical protein
LQRNFNNRKKEITDLLSWRIFFGFNFAHDFEISAIKPPHRRERNARTVVLEEVGT